MQEFIVQRDNKSDLKFVGKVIGAVSSSSDTGRWTELRLYKTRGGNWVCEMVGRTEHDGEHDRRSADFFDDHENVVDFFGYGWLAKHLYKQAKIDATENVD